MADIFTSYSKADRDKLVLLSAYLESEGWTVWWDKNLNPGEPYRDEIMRELVSARAVIVLWTPTSIKSDFVRAEAGRAKADGKLIPVKTDDVNYGDIPLPFGEMHTEPLSNKELIRAAVVAQLAKPAVQPSALWVATKTLRYQVLTWVGIVGGAVTLFANLREVLNLADWARWLVTNWHQLTVAFWRIAFGWTGIRITAPWATALSFTAFALLTALAARRSMERSSNERSVLPYLRWSYAALLAVIIGAFIMSATIKAESLVHNILMVAFLCAPVVVAVLKAGIGVLRAIAFSSLFMVFSVAITKSVLLGSERIEYDEFSPIYVVLMLYLFPPILLAIAPIAPLLRRLSFLFIGFVMLIALNELSHYAPDIRSLLKAPD